MSVKDLGNAKNEIAEELEKVKNAFSTELEKTERILRFIDVKRAPIGIFPSFGVFSSNVELATHYFIYETEKNLYILMCNYLGQKIKHVKQEFSNLSLEVIKGPSKENLIKIIGNDGWYVRTGVNNKSLLELKDLVNERNIPLRYKKEGYSKQLFFLHPIFLIWWFLFFIVAIAFIIDIL